MKISLELQLAKEDYFEFSYYTTWTASWNKKKRLLHYLKIAGLSVAIAFLLFSFSKEKPTVTFLILFGSFAIIYIGFLVPAIYKHSYRQNSKKIFNDPNNKFLKNLTLLDIDEKGVYTKDESGYSFHEWNAIIKCAITRKHYFLYLSALTAFIIPKWRLKSMTDKTNLEMLLQDNLASKIVRE